MINFCTLQNYFIIVNVNCHILVKIVAT